MKFRRLIPTPALAAGRNYGATGPLPIAGEGQLSICGRLPLGKGKRTAWRGAWSDAVICPASDAAGRQPPACMGVRGPGPDHPKRARGTVESPGCPSPVSPTVAPYSPSVRPHVLAIVVSLSRRGRSSVGATFDQQGPDDARHLFGQSNGDQHFRLASQHLRKPRPLGCAAPAGLLDHGTRPNDQQAADRPVYRVSKRHRVFACRRSISAAASVRARPRNRAPPETPRPLAPAS